MPLRSRFMESTVPPSGRADLLSEERFLLAATHPSLDADGPSAGSAPGAEDPLPRPVLEAVDPVRLARVALRNKVVGRCGRFLDGRFDGWNGLGPGWARLARLTRLQTQRETRRHRECAALVQDLGRAGVECCPLKGTFLSLELYGDARVRDTTDIDLLVHRECLAEALDIVQRRGYRLPRHEAVPRSARHRALLGRVKGHHFTLEHPERDTQLELHWALSYHRRLPGEADDGLWDHVESVRTDGLRFHRMRVPWRLLYLAMHGAEHQWNRLSWLADFAVLATRCSKAATAASAQSRAQGLVVVWNAACLLSDTWYGTDLAGEVAEGLRGRRVRQLVNEARLFRADPRPSAAGLRRYERAACDTRLASLRVVLRRFLLPSIVEVRSPSDLRPGGQTWRALLRKLRRLLPPGGDR